MARILLVNDEPDLLELAQWILEAAGHTVERALGGPEIVERARRWRPDAIVLDWVMPRLSGEQAVELLRANPATAHVPIVLMTALPDGAARAARLGVEGFLPKPFDERQLLDAIAPVLARAHEEERPR